MEKCLVCIICQDRAHELTWGRFQHYVLRQLDADLALCVGYRQDNPRNSGFYQSAKYIWEYPEPKDYADAFDYISKELGAREDWRMLLQIKDHWLGGIEGPETQPGSGAIVLFYRWLLKKHLLENRLLEQYDRFIVTRSDYYYCAPHPPLYLISPDYVWLPDGEDWGGYTDRHVVASCKDIVACVDMLENAVKQPQLTYEEMKDHQGWNPEQYIAHSYRKNGIAEKIRRFPFVMFSVRGESGTTRWGEGETEPETGLRVKYPGEFQQSYKGYCGKIKNNDDWRRVLAEY